jgi:hypothetical protein
LKKDLILLNVRRFGRLLSVNKIFTEKRTI